AYLGAHHALAACFAAPVVAFVLPAAWLMLAGAHDADVPASPGEDHRSPMGLWRAYNHLPSEVWPIAGRAWPNVRETAVYVWRFGDDGPPRIGLPLVWR